MQSYSLHDHDFDSDAARKFFICHSPKVKSSKILTSETLIFADESVSRTVCPTSAGNQIFS